MWRSQQNMISDYATSSCIIRIHEPRCVNIDLEDVRRWWYPRNPHEPWYVIYRSSVGSLLQTLLKYFACILASYTTASGLYALPQKLPQFLLNFPAYCTKQDIAPWSLFCRFMVIQACMTMLLAKKTSQQLLGTRLFQISLAKAQSSSTSRPVSELRKQILFVIYLVLW